MTRAGHTIQEMLKDLAVLQTEGDLSRAVAGVQYDSRQVGPGDIFVAMAGLEADGHRFVAQAVERGAVAVVCSQAKIDTGSAAMIRVAETRSALARLAAKFWDHPSAHMELLGITGTNGKTTLTYLWESMAQAAGLNPGVIGTTGVRYAGQSQELAHTTPEAPDLQRLLAQMRAAGVSQVAMEVSSHALDLQRTLACHFQVAIFTNLSRDHLDYHGDMDRYAAAKALLFSRELAQSHAAAKTAVVNRDDPRWQQMVADFHGPVLSFGFDPQADVRPLAEPRYSLGGFQARVASPAGELDLVGRLPGKHNLQNCLAAVAAAVALGLSAETIVEGIASCLLVPGRLQRVSTAGQPTVFVDYAHTDNALVHVCSALRPLTKGRLWVVFGCGGDRDQGKRPLMGQAVARHADLAVVTSDNPRHEDPDAILAQIVPGLTQESFEAVDPEVLAQSPGKQYAVISDRAQAIARAVTLAQADDVVLVAGKGHENYQIIGAQRSHFDDAEQVQAALALWPQQVPT